MKELYFATGNKNKLREAQAILGKDINLIGVSFDSPEIQSTDERLVLEYKVARILEKGVDKPFIVEDQGLHIDSLKGYPGALIKSFWETLGSKGICELVDAHAYLVDHNHNATAVGVVAYADKAKGIIQYFRGELKGLIAEEPSGTNGWGWDDLFIPGKTVGPTFGEMTPDEKNAISMRRLALKQLKAYLAKLE